MPNRWSDCLCRVTRLLILLAVTAGGDGRAAPVISELMFHPAHEPRSPEPVAQEWLELSNRGLTLDLGGWQLTRGVEFEFPAGTVMPAGSRLVVAADVAAFLEAHPNFHGAVVGGWAGRLSNRGERIRLVDRTGNVADEVEYADEGEWATRGRSAVDPYGRAGWEWFNAADGLGASLEKGVEGLRGSIGRNWRPSAARGGTPGQPNSASLLGQTTFILDVQVAPLIPRPAQPITVKAHILDVISGTRQPRWQLRWRIDGEDVFRSADMIELNRVAITTSDLPAVHEMEVTATLPGQANRAVIEFFLEAQGSEGRTTWPAAVRVSAPGVDPEVFEQAANALLQVDDTHDPEVPWMPGAQPIYRLVMTGAELAYLRDLQTRSNRSESAATMNATFISQDGTGLEVRWMSGVRNRGYSSRNGPPNNYHVSFPRDAPWQELGSVQFNCRYPYSQVLGTAAYALAGLPVQEAAPVQVRLNATNYAMPFSPGNEFNGAITHGAYARVETLGSDWADRHYPDDSEGNLYRVDDHAPGNSNATNDFRYPGSADPDAYDDLYFKQTNQDLNDYSDLAGLFNALNNAPANSFFQEILARLNLDQWLTYFAIDALMGNMEGGLVSGRTDDFSMYRGTLDQRFVLIPHDMDTTFNYGTGGAGSPVTRSLFSYVNSNGGVAGLQRFFDDPDVGRAYYAKVLELLDTVFTRERFDPLIDELFGGWLDPATVRIAKTFIDDRRANVLNQIPRTYSLTTNLTTVTDGLATTINGQAVFSGTFHAAQTRSILVNGHAATLRYRPAENAPAGSWRFDTASVPGFLGRGVSRVSVEFFDGPGGTGTLLHHAHTDVLNAMAPAMTPVSRDGIPLASSLHIEAPTTYVPGIPILVKAERRDALGRLDLSGWEESITLSTGNEVALTAADGSPPIIRMRNGRGSGLISIGGGSDVALRLIEPGGSRQSPNPSAALWKYLDSGGAPDPGWRSSLAFDDGEWKPADASGAPGQFGAGDDDERTVVANVPTSSNAANARFTWYFRHRFSVADPSSFSSATLRILFDDGVAVYVNGLEVLRRNLPAGATHFSPATSNRSGSAENSFQSFDLPVTTLVPGENLIAVELHNARVSDSAVSLDLGFDLELLAGERPADPGNFTLLASAGGQTASRAITSLGPSPTLTEVEGMLAPQTRWSGVVVVTGDVTVPLGGTLTVAPGTHVLLSGTEEPGDTAGADLRVLGSLRIAGTEEEPVSLTSASPETRWGEIFLAENGDSIISHAFISRGAHSPGRGHTGRGPMLRMSGARLVMDGCVLSDAPGKALYTQGAGSLVITGSHIARCVTGPELGDGMSLALQDSHLTDFLPEYRENNAPGPDDEDCLYIHNGSQKIVVLRRSVLGRCGDDVIDALGGPLMIEDCVIREGWDKGVSLLNNQLVMTRSLVIGCDKALAVKGSSPDPFLVSLRHCTLVSENHDTTRGPWGYQIDPSSPDDDTPATGLYTQNKAGQSHPDATMAIDAQHCIIVARDPVTVDAPYPPDRTTIAYSITRSTEEPAGSAWPGLGNFNADPLFVQPSGPSKDFRLQAGSPAIDAGDPTASFDPDGSRADLGAMPFGGSPTGPVGKIVWRAAHSPLHVAHDLTIPKTTMLEVEPGTSVYFEPNRRLTVHGPLRILGSRHARVMFSHVPGSIAPGDADPVVPGFQTGPPKWGGLRLVDSMASENVISHATFINAQGTSPTGPENFGSLAIIRSWALCDSLDFAGTRLRMLYARNSKLTVQHCRFPDMFEAGDDPEAYGVNGTSQHLVVEFPTSDPEIQANPLFDNGFPIDGWLRIYRNNFYGNRGRNANMRVESGRRGSSPVLDCRFNRFHGWVGDDHIELAGDGYVASNTFRGGTRDAWSWDAEASSAVAAAGGSVPSTLLLARNIFLGVDHAVALADRAAAIFEHNTVAGINPDYAFLIGRPPVALQGAANSVVKFQGPENEGWMGAYLGYNLISEVPRLLSGAGLIVEGPGLARSKLDIHHNLLHRIGDLPIRPNTHGGVIDPRWGINVFGTPGFVDSESGDFRLVAGSDAHGTAPGGLDYGATSPEWAYVLGGPASMTGESEATFVIRGPGLVEYRWSLNGSPWSAPILIGTGGQYPQAGSPERHAILNLGPLGPGTQVLRVVGRDFAGNWQPESLATTRTWQVEPTLRWVIINEVVANPGEGENDWIEIHNAGTSAVELTDWSLGEAPGEARYHFPAGALLPAGSFLHLPGTLTGIGSDKDGDNIHLWEGQTLRDKVDFGAQPVGFSVGRLGLERVWGLAMPTPGSANAPAKLGDAWSLRISEWLAAHDVRYSADWVELDNPSALPVSLEGLILTDNRAGRPRAHVLSPLSFIGPHAQVAYWADGDTSAPDRLPFKLNALEDGLSLMHPGGWVIDQRILYGQTNDFSQGVDPSGQVVFHELPTRGFEMSGDDPLHRNALAVLRGLRLTELMFNAPAGNDEDWLELSNLGNVAIDLSGLRFVDGIDFTFPSLVLDPGRSVVVVAHAASFRTRHGPGPVVAGEYGGRLDNGGETLTLRLASPFDANVFSFQYEDEWLPETDGRGRSLELAAAKTPVPQWNHPDSWVASAVDHGTPGFATQWPPSTYTAWKHFHRIVEDHGDPDQDGVSSFLEFALGSDPRDDRGLQGTQVLPLVSQDPEGRLTITFILPENSQAIEGHGRDEVRYEVQESQGLEQWGTIASKSRDLPWSTPAAVTVDAHRLPAGGHRISVAAPSSHQGSARQHLRLRVVWTP